MTKQEVENNIRYNEKLVRQYRSQLQENERLQREKEAEISRLVSKQQSMNKAIEALDVEIDELSRLKSKFNNLQESFIKKQEKRKRAFDMHFGCQVMSAKFIKSYIDGMNDLLQGTQYRKTLFELVKALEIVAEEGNRKRRKRECIFVDVSGVIEDLKNERVYYASLQSRHKQLLSDYNYRQNRIIYWRNQLRYAT